MPGTVYLLGQPVPGTGYKVEKLRHGVQKVEDLWYHEQQHCFTEMAQNGDHCKRHTREVTERVSNEHRGRVPVQNKQETLK